MIIVIIMKLLLLLLTTTMRACARHLKCSLTISSP
jgi:hypothetical protein